MKKNIVFQIGLIGLILVFNSLICSCGGTIAPVVKGDPYLYQEKNVKDEGQYDTAIDHFSTSLKMNPSGYIAYMYMMRGKAYYYKGEYDMAISDYNAAIDRAGRIFPFGYNILGNAYYYKGEYEKAISNYNTILGLQSMYAPAYYNRGKAYFEIGKYEKALNDVNKAEELNDQVSGEFLNEFRVEIKSKLEEKKVNTN